VFFRYQSFFSFFGSIQETLAHAGTLTRTRGQKQNMKGQHFVGFKERRNGWW